MTPVSTPVEAVPDEVREPIGNLRFGEAVTNVAASEENPIKHGWYMRRGVRTGRMNAGAFVEYVTDDGRVHQTPPDNITRRSAPAIMADRAIRPASPPRADAGEDGSPCERCQGNGELVTDWDRYRHSKPNDVGDEAVADCPDCDGTGRLVTQPDEAVRASQEDELRQAVIAECVAHIEYVRENIVITPSARRRFDLHDLNQAFRNALKIAKERITGEDKGLWLSEKEAAARQAHRDQRGGDGV